MAELSSGSKVTAGTIVPLNEYHDRKSFDCGEPPLNDFLMNHGLGSMLGSTYVLVRDLDSPEIIAYFTFFPDVIAILTGERKPSIASVVKLEYLAVDRKYQRQGLGQDLLVYIMRQVAEYANMTSIVALAIEPLNEKARKWFLGRNFGFEPAELPHLCLAISVETLLSMDEPEHP